MSSFSHYRVHLDEQVPILRGTKDEECGRFLENMQDKLKITILKLDKEECEFDLIGVDVSIANALRRILIAEVPTVAIENVFISVNTSIIQDEVLAHRLGLIPMKIDPRLMEYRDVGQVNGTESDTIVFNFNVACPDPPAHYTAEQKQIFNYKVLSKELELFPNGAQLETFVDGIRPVHDDIVIAVLRPGQRIEIEAHCVKGIGKDHTKFSPVATASYKLMPDISFPVPVIHDKAYELAKMCPMKVFDIEDIGNVPTAVVSRPRDCTMCRECIRKDGWNNTVHLKRVTDHFIFRVESSGCMKPEDIVVEAIEILRHKSEQFIAQLVEQEECV